VRKAARLRRPSPAAIVTLAIALLGCGGPSISSAAPTVLPAATLGDPPSFATPSRQRTQRPSATDQAAASGSPAATQPSSPRFPGGLLIADRLNNRLLVVNDDGTIRWRFPVAGSLPPGETFSADDAFVTPDGKSVVANEESNQIIVRIDIATETIVWEYGTYRVKGSAPNQLSTPDIRNCRIIEISPDGQLVKQMGIPGNCVDNPPTTFAQPNGDTPLPDGGLLVTEITGSRVVRLSAAGTVMYNVAVPVKYPSDAQLLPNGNILVVDYSNPGAVVVVDPTTGATVYRYGPQTGDGALNRPSLAIALPDGTFALNDDYNHRVVVIDPQTSSIVWSYGHNGQASASDGYLNLPDGINVAPVGAFP